MVDPRLLEPFWLSETMRGESLFFVDRGDGVPAASLLFAHAEGVTLTSATGDVEFESGLDFVVDGEAGLVRLTTASRIPWATLEELYPAREPFVLIAAEDDEFHRRQTGATYSHRSGDWRGCVPRLAAVELPRTFQRLAASEPLTLCITGDSISEGFNASGVIGAPPFQPPYAALVHSGLEHACQSPITLHNFAVSGWTSDHGVADVSRVAQARPDLVIVAFGMNDAGYAEAPDFAANIAGIMSGVRAASPDAEFVLVSPMLPNPRWDYTVIERFGAYRAALSQLCGAGAALADLTSLWTDLLDRKSVHDLTGNGINHPNDFGHRLYAQTILGLLVEPSMWLQRF
jgi:lysophospholipase L1-like esterase